MIALLSGHGFKGTPTPDPGACGPAVCEAAFTADLAIATVAELRRRGADAHALTLGAYATRREAAGQAGASLLVHVHGDMGTPAVYHYPGSVAGQRAAEAIARAVGLPVRAAERDAFDRVRNVLGADRMPSVLVEAVDMRTVTGLDWVPGFAIKLALGIIQTTQRAAA